MDEIIIPALLFIGIIIFISRIITISNRSRNRAENRSKLDNLAIQMNSLEEKLDELLKRTAPAANHVVTAVEPEKKEAKEFEIPKPKITEIEKVNTPLVEKIIPEIPVPEMEVPVEKVESVPQDFSYTPQPGFEHLYESSESWWTRFNKRNPDLEKFVGENLISKIGIAILVLGIAFFVKYAIDKDWINEYARVGIGILAGGIVLLFAHRLREKFKQFSSILVGGAIAIFYFTITIGFQEYKVFSQPVAFAIMIAITAFSVFISLAYNRQELAVLSLIGGFAAPFMVSTGDGNYKVLFSYLLILDAGMLVISFARNWKLVYVLSYIFTLVIYGGWFFQKVQGQMEAPYLGALIFPNRL